MIEIQRAGKIGSVDPHWTVLRETNVNGWDLP